MLVVSLLVLLVILTAGRAQCIRSLTSGLELTITSALSFMTNGVLSFLPNRSWHPFVGAGIGMSRISAEWKVNGSKVVDDSDWVFAYQAFAGVSYDLTKNWELSAQYRYFATQDPEFSDNSGDRFSGEYASHAILAGVSYKFAK